jgi:exoribonuclease R
LPLALTHDICALLTHTNVYMLALHSTDISAALYPSATWRHFALNICNYTHFTSPIRRYADLMVHRLLTSVLDDSQESLYTTEVRELHVYLVCLLYRL